MKQRGKDLIKNTGILLIAKISTQVVSFLLLPLYTALLSTEEYGEIDIYSSLLMILIPFLTLQVEMGVFRFLIMEKEKKQKSRIITTAVFVVLFQLALGTIVYVVLVCFLHINNPVLVFLYYVSSTVLTLLLQICRGYGDNKGYAIASFVSSSLAVLLNVVLVAGIGMKVQGVLLSTVIANLISCIYVVTRTRVHREIRKKFFDKDLSRKLLKYSVPLVFNQIASWGINYSDRVIILSFLGVSLNGIYSLANKFSSIMNTFFNVFNLAWTENVCKGMDDDNNADYVNRMYSLIFSIYIFIVTSIINVLPLVFKIMVNSKFDDAYNHVPILVLSAFFSGMSATIGSIYIAYNKTKEVSITTLLAGGCNIVIHLLLLHFCGLYAASISTLCSFLLLYIYRLVFVKKFFPLKTNKTIAISYLVVYCFSSFAYYIREIWLVIVAMMVNFMVFGFILSRNKELMRHFKKH